MAHQRLAHIAAAAVVTATLLASPSAQAVAFSTFAFASQTSTSGLFGGVNGIYGNGDVRLDGVTIGSTVYAPSQLQTVSGATIVIDDGVDTVNGGGNFAAGHGLNAVADTWVGEGPKTVTPSSSALYGALANFNLTSIVVTRENNGTAVLDVSFAQATQDFLFYERGFNSDIQVQALNVSNQVIGSYTVLRADYAQTGILISTDNGAFTLAGQELGSIGLHTDEAVSRLRLSSYKSDTLNFNGPDFKVLALNAVTAVPEPETYAMLLAGLVAVGALKGRRRDRR